MQHAVRRLVDQDTDLSGKSDEGRACGSGPVASSSERSTLNFLVQSQQKLASCSTHDRRIRPDRFFMRQSLGATTVRYNPPPLLAVLNHAGDSDEI